MPTGEIHKKMGYISYISLPYWQRKWWDFSLKGFLDIGEKFYKSKEEKLKESCLIPDYMGCKFEGEKYRNYKKFLLFEEKIIPHGPCDEDFNSVWTSFKGHNQYNFLLVLNYYVERFFNSLKSKKFDLSVIYAGILGHIIQECSYPSHTLPNLFFYNYFPRRRNFFPVYHDIIDNIYIKKFKFKPEIIGLTPEEISFKLWVEIERNILWQKRNLIKILNFINENKKGLSKILKPSIEKGIKLFSDLLYSSISIASFKIKEKDVKKLEKFSLCNMVPYYVHPGGKYRDIPGNYSIIDGKKRPLVLKNKKIKEGLGISPYVSLKYILQPGIFSRFICKVGISSITKEKKVKKTGVKFIIEIDKNINYEYTPDHNYKNTEKIFCKELSFDRVFDIDLNIKKARTLIISAVSYEININGFKKFLFPDIVIENPLLSK